MAGFSSAVSRAVVFDNKVAVDSSTVAAKFGLSFSVETKLTDLVILNLRQTIGSLELTTSRLSNGRLGGMDDLRIFMKDMGSSKCVTLLPLNDHEECWLNVSFPFSDALTQWKPFTPHSQPSYT